MPTRLSKTALVLIFFTLTLILSIIGMFLMVSIYHPTYAVVATNKQNNEPERYVLLENPDRYTLEAINNGHSDVFDSYDKTNIDELNQANSIQFGHEDFYYKYGNSYYSFGIVIGDNFPPFLFPQMLLTGIVVSIAAIVIISSYTKGKYIKSKMS